MFNMKKKRLISLICAALLAITAVGCSSSNPADTEAVMTALDKFGNCKSFTVIQTTECREIIRMDNEEQVYNSLNELELSLITEPALQMTSVSTTKVENEGDIFEQSSISYIVPYNGGYTEYIYNGAEWYKLSTEDGSALAGIGADSIVATFFADRLSYRKVGTESLDNGKAVRYEGKLGGDDLISMLGGFGYLNSVAAMSANQQAKIMENLLKDLNDVPVSVWVDEASGYPVRFQAGMSDILKDVDKSINKSLGNKASDSEYYITDCVISMTVKDINSVSEVVIPPEAASAKPYETAE